MRQRKLTRATTWTRRALVAAGAVALAYAVTGAVGSRDMRLPYVRFLALAPVAHELVLMPLAIAAGVLIGRFTPVALRSVVQAALFISAVVIVVALPAVLGFGRSADLPSALPRHYGVGLIIVLAVVWGSVAAAMVAKRFFHYRKTPKGQP